MSEDARSKIRDLLRLARHPGTPRHEAEAAARAAARRMREEEIAEADLGPEDELRAPALARPDVVVIGTPLLVVTESSSHYRMAKLTPPARFSSHLILVPKRYVREIVWMSSTEAVALGWKGGSRITKAVALERGYFQDAVSSGWNSWC